jgi:hypothetical protein
VRLPFAIAQELVAGAVNQQGQRAIGATMRNLDGERQLPSAQGGVVRYRPVQVRPLKQAGNHAGRFLERQLERDLKDQIELDRRIREHRGATEPAVMRREAGHVLVQTDQHRPARARRRRVAGPVPCAAAGRGWLVHPPRLSAWTNVMNPLQPGLFNNEFPTSKR